ncbi:MAG: hypothetical protein KAT66_03655, partial [Candidatus Lokiarchaeota archaeon]|nr:hypothetical protein [Candidatus Lokiarchaeota archaeon]
MVVITTKKPTEEVIEALENYKIKKLAIVSCGSCAALCQTGGTEGAKEWNDLLIEKGYEVTAVIVSEDVCDNRVMKKDLRKIDDEIQESDAILTLSCGLGLQSIVKVLENKYPEKIVLGSNNTEFIGMTERIG